MPELEFGSRDVANAFRDENEEHLDDRDDRRRKLVVLDAGAPERVMDEGVIRAASSKEERATVGQEALEEHERERIDFSETTVPHARAAKAVLLEAGVDDWLSYYDKQLTVEEHHDLAERAAAEGGGRRMDAENTVQSRLGDLEAALDGQCEHAKQYCESGESDACEFLVDDCGLTESVVGALRDPDAGATDDSRLPGPIYNALGDAWTGYKAALAEDDQGRARRFAAVINAIRDQQGQDLMVFEELDSESVTWDDVEQIGPDEPRIMEDLPDARLHPEELRETGLTPADVENETVDSDRAGTRVPAKTSRGKRAKPVLGDIPDDELYREIGRREATDRLVDDRGDVDDQEGLFRHAENDA
ncbi:hypothetical protein, partial [Halostella sp. PRR32]|uniref:hypothetical protein n=1 Tax=Halostella sp. PRR32 TaxID=3098147 RepID=UPI0034E0B2E1